MSRAPRPEVAARNALFAACLSACTPAPRAAPPPSPIAPVVAPAADDFTEARPGSLPPAGDLEVLPFERAAYTGACPSAIGAAVMGSAPNGWSCLAYESGVMHMCVGTEEPVAGGGDLSAYARTAIDAMGPAGIRMVDRRDVVLNGQPAVRLVYDEPDAPGRFVSYLFARNGQGFTATCAAAPPDSFEDSLPGFEAALQRIRFR